jgi:hypothetical protein
VRAIIDFLSPHGFPEVLKVPFQPIKILLATRTSDKNVNTPYAGDATYKWKVHNGKIEIISFVVKFCSKATLTQIRGLDIKQT